MERIKEEFRRAGIDSYSIELFKPCQKRTNGGDENLSLVDILNHDHCDETSIALACNHIDIIKKAYKSGDSVVTIFEDDFMIQGLAHDKLKHITNWLKTNRWDIFYFGHCPMPVLLSIPMSSNIVKVFTPLLGHAYTLSRAGMSRVLWFYEYNKNLHIDKMLSICPISKYACFPSVIFQTGPPALYRKSMKLMGIDIDHNKLFLAMEYTAYCMFFILIALTIYLLYRLAIYISRRKSIEKV